MSLADEPNRQLTLTLAVAGVAVVLVLLAALLVLAMVMRQRARAERRLAEALAQVEERKRYTDMVLDTLDIAVAVCDAEGRPTYFNRLMKRYFGIDAAADITTDVDADDLSDRYTITNVDGTPLDANESPMIRAIRTDSAVSSELVARGQDGSELWVHGRAVPLHAADGSVLGAVVGYDDVTLRRRQEAEVIEARDQAEQAGQAKTAFLAAMSHEIRTPLNAVLGLTDLLLTTELTEEQRSHLETIAGSGDALLALINDILDFSKIEAGGLDLDAARAALRAGRRSRAPGARAPGRGAARRSRGRAFEGCSPLPPARAGGEGWGVPPATPAGFWQVRGEAARLRQGVMNLVGNAVK